MGRHQQKIEVIDDFGVCPAVAVVIPRQTHLGKEIVPTLGAPFGDHPGKGVAQIGPRLHPAPDLGEGERRSDHTHRRRDLVNERLIKLWHARVIHGQPHEHRSPHLQGQGLDGGKEGKALIGGPLPDQIVQRPRHPVTVSIKNRLAERSLHDPPMRPVIAEIPQHQSAAEQPVQHFPATRAGKQIVSIAQNEFQRVRTTQRHPPFSQQLDLVNGAESRL